MSDDVRLEPVQPRIGGADDAQILAEFNQAIALETEARALAEDVALGGVKAVLCDSAHGFYVVAESGGEIAGALLVTYEWSDWRNGRIWWIQSVYVRPGHRRRGVYRTLHEFVRNRARLTGGVVGLRLYVERGNAVAQRTYSAMGMNEAPYLVYEEVLP